MSDRDPGNHRRDETYGAASLPPPGTWGPPPGAGGPAVSPLAPPADSTWYVAPPTKKRRKGRAIIATVAAVALLGGGTFAAVALSGSDGAATPSAAVKGFFDALGREDVLGMLDAMPTGERDALRPLAEELTSELERLGITSKIDLGRLPGLDIEVKDLVTHSEDLGGGVAGVWIDSGTISVKVIPQDVPIGENLKSLVEHFTGQPVEITATSEESTLHMDSDGSPIVTIKEGGGWKLSAFYSYAEFIRRQSDSPLPAFGQGLDAVGSDSPEAAVQALADALVKFDLERVVALTPPKEMQALHDYAPLFLGRAEDAAGSMRDESGVSLTLGRLDLESSGSADRRTVAVKGAAIHIESNEGSADIDYDGTCVTITGDLANNGDGGTQKQCAGDLPATPELQGLGDLLLRTRESALTVVKEDGKWYVSPVGTLGETLVRTLQAMTPDDLKPGGALYKLIEGLQNLGSGITVGGG